MERLQLTGPNAFFYSSFFLIIIIIYFFLLPLPFPQPLQRLSALFNWSVGAFYLVSRRFLLGQSALFTWSIGAFYIVSRRFLLGQSDI